MNSINIIGRLVRNVDLKKTKAGKDMARFLIAVPRKYKRSEEDKPYYFKISVFNGSARACYEHLVQGSKVGVQGYLHQSNYIDKDCGKNISYYEIVALSIDFLGEPKNKSENETAEDMYIDEDGIPYDELEEYIPESDNVEKPI